jgi:hypothetical protein
LLDSRTNVLDNEVSLRGGISIPAAMENQTRKENLMTPETLSSLAGILLSLLASYLPGFSPWFDNLEPNLKRLFMLPLLLAVAIGSYGVSCAGWGELADPLVACNTSGMVAIARAFIAALIANQAAYAISPRRS